MSLDSGVSVEWVEEWRTAISRGEYNIKYLMLNMYEEAQKLQPGEASPVSSSQLNLYGAAFNVLKERAEHEKGFEKCRFIIPILEQSYAKLAGIQMEPQQIQVTDKKIA